MSNPTATEIDTMHAQLNDVLEHEHFLDHNFEWQWNDGAFKLAIQGPIINKRNEPMANHMKQTLDDHEIHYKETIFRPPGKDEDDAEVMDRYFRIEIVNDDDNMSRLLAWSKDREENSSN